MSKLFARREMAKTRFRDTDLAETAFENVNLAASRFDDVNLAEASFRNINLAGATIHGAYLRDLVITDSNIENMTVNGFRIDQLIEEQLDLRDPLRRRFRMADITDPQSIGAMLDQLDQLRRSFAGLLRAADRDMLSRRPLPAQWSPLLILRHLVYAEELARSVGAHGTVGRTLQRLALHDLEHIRDAETLLSGQAQEGG